jgi:hypothetical protein
MEFLADLKNCGFFRNLYRHFAIFTDFLPPLTWSKLPPDFVSRNASTTILNFNLGFIIFRLTLLMHFM